MQRGIECFPKGTIRENYYFSSAGHLSMKQGSLLALPTTKARI
jgi:hypothetical protein